MEPYIQEYAATTIAKHFRGYRTRKNLRKQRELDEGRLAAWEAARSWAVTTDQAARIIQHAWQSFRNQRIYHYYRDLIQFRERGDPKELLRSINPREAQLADAASGIHVRFRLGGTVFPPLVFYKIYTHRPVTDICAFCPRDYAKEMRLTASEVNNKQPRMQSQQNLKPQKAKRVFSEDFDIEASFREYLKPDGTVGLRSTRGWYERAENNGWRPISERILVDEDPVTTMTKLKRMPLFHFSPGVRREERIRRAKQRKREWMIKLYKEGHGTGGTAGRAIMSDDVEDDDGDYELDGDDETNDLLQWTQQLNFESYVSDWTSTACTLGTEAFVPELETDLVIAPPPSHDLRRAMATAGVPLQPFKAGATPASCTVTARIS